MKSKHVLTAFLIFTAAFANAQKDTTGNAFTTFEIKPSETDASITSEDVPHLVMFNPKAKQGKLLLFMTGTGGIANKGPKDFYNTVVEQGYVLISLSYIDVPAVAQICHDTNLDKDPNCADEFRMKRIYGTGDFSLIDDKPQDAIVNRLTKLLVYLSAHHKEVDWTQYLDNGQPKWSEIAVCGQSQGGGMAEYLGKHEVVYRVISFSGGWDWSAKDKIAKWYATSNKTPANAWYGTYNVKEATADVILKTYQALAMPATHIYGLDLPVRDVRKAHVEGVANPAYKPKWIEMLSGKVASK